MCIGWMPKKLTIETVDLDGKQRTTVIRFPQGVKPYKMDLFEDKIFVSMSAQNSVMVKRFDKFGRFGLNGATIYQGEQQRAPDIVVLQENKHPRPLVNVCQKTPCHSSALCVPQGNHPGSTNRTCLCPDGYNATISSAMMVECNPKPKPAEQCNLNCRMGKCQITGDGPRCICEPMYGGEFCSKYLCSEYCHHGRCDAVIDPRSGKPVPKCTCAPQWTGERCDSPLANCGCENGGTCVSPARGVVYCMCQPQFTGPRCQDCISLKCAPNGSCYVQGSEPKCNCSRGYIGKNCEISKCDGFCKGNSTCKITSGGPKCVCAPGFAGDKCEKDKCKDFCKNGGLCIHGNKKQSCHCGPRYTGSLCEVDLCNCSCETYENAGQPCPCIFPPPEECKSNVVQKCRPGMCKNGGVCILSRGNPVCRCMEEFNGPECETYFGARHACVDFCQNDGACHLDGKGNASCSCLDNWFGLNCNKTSPCTLGYCLNSGQCSNEDEKPKCICPRDFNGVRCEIPVIGNSPSAEGSGGGGSSTGVIVSVTILIILLLGVAVAYYVTKRIRRGGKSFLHQRMTENVEISNPMYLREDIDDDGDNFTLDSIVKGNFSNPMYESMYNSGASTASGAASEEKKGLLRGDDVPTQPHPLAGSREEL